MSANCQKRALQPLSDDAIGESVVQSGVGQTSSLPAGFTASNSMMSCLINCNYFS
jgi:hypothetical protein